jgi:hypothetical protein
VKNSISILLPSFSCQFLFFQDGDLDSGVVEVDPLDTLQFGMGKQDIQMLLIGGWIA